MRETEWGVIQISPSSAIKQAHREVWKARFMLDGLRDGPLTAGMGPRPKRGRRARLFRRGAFAADMPAGPETGERREFGDSCAGESLEPDDIASGFGQGGRCSEVLRRDRPFIGSRSRGTNGRPCVRSSREGREFGFRPSGSPAKRAALSGAAFSR